MGPPSESVVLSRGRRCGLAEPFGLELLEAAAAAVSVTPFSTRVAAPSFCGVQSSCWDGAGGRGTPARLLAAPPRDGRLLRRRRGLCGAGATLSAEDTLSTAHTVINTCLHTCSSCLRELFTQLTVLDLDRKFSALPGSRSQLSLPSLRGR